MIADLFAIGSENLIFARNYEMIDSCGISLKTRQKGTRVYFSVHRDTQKTLAGASHANPDDGFFRVTLPLKLMTLTGTALIARSQARRFTFNFIDKREVVLDFDGITELCQPFAHELFCVYHKAHPEVRLITRNTTEVMDRLIQRLMMDSRGTNPGWSGRKRWNRRLVPDVSRRVEGRTTLRRPVGVVFSTG